MKTTEIIDKATNILKGKTWATKDGIFINNESFAMVIKPFHLPTLEIDQIDDLDENKFDELIAKQEQDDFYQVSVSLLPTDQTVTPQLEGCPVFLQGDTKYWGRLNKKGQVLFPDIPAGTYTTEIRLSPSLAEQKIENESSVMAKIFNTIKNWVKFPVAKALPITLLGNSPVYGAVSASNESESKSSSARTRYQNSSQDLVGYLYENKPGRYEIEFRSDNKEWEGQLILFKWQASETSKPQDLVAPMFWSSKKEQTIAQLSLGAGKPEAEVILFPEEPILLEDWLATYSELSPETKKDLLEEMSYSVERANTRLAILAWEKLAQKPELPEEIKTMIINVINSGD